MKFVLLNICFLILINLAFNGCGSENSGDNDQQEDPFLAGDLYPVTLSEEEISIHSPL